MKQLHSIRFNITLMWCAKIRLAGRCGNVVRNLGCSRNILKYKRKENKASQFAGEIPDGKVAF